MVQASRKVARRPKPAGADRIEVLISGDRIRARVAELGRQITRDYHGREVVAVCILKGSFMFTADLVRQIGVPVIVDFLRVSSYGKGTVSSGNVRLDSDVEIPLRNRDVLLIEDIVDTGHTLHNLIGRVSAKKPSSLAVCALLHKPEREQVRVPIDYLGFTIPNVFVVGYGLDFAGKHRALPHLGALHPAG